jgi:TRAP transporter TAXI family solute receptor
MTRSRRSWQRYLHVLVSSSSAIALLLGLVVFGTLAFRYFSGPSVLRLAVGPPGSVDVAFAEAMQRHEMEDLGQVHFEIVRTDSAAASSAALDQGRADLAIVRNDVAVPKHAGTILIVHRDAVLLVANAKAKISQISDLKRKRVGIIPGDAANVALLDALLAQYGVAAESVGHIPVDVKDMDRAIDGATMDAVFAIAGLGTPLLTKIVAAASRLGKDAPLIVDVKDTDALALNMPGIDKVDVPSGFFAGTPPRPSDDITTVGVAYQLVVRLDVADGIVDQLTKWLFSVRRLLAADAPVADRMQAPATEKGARFALHPGATAYYQDTEKSFMDRYGDWFYIIAMAAGGIGSILASIVSSFRARRRHTALAVVDELVAVRHDALIASSLDKLKTLETSVDDVALRALYHARDNRLDESGLVTIQLALDEARRGIADGQKRLIGGQDEKHSPEDEGLKQDGSSDIQSATH